MNVINEIKIRRMRWAGNMQRLDEKRIPKNILDGKFYNARIRIRPRNRWDGWSRCALGNVLALKSMLRGVKSN